MIFVATATIADAQELERIYDLAFGSNAPFFPDNMEEDDAEGEEEFSFLAALSEKDRIVLALRTEQRLTGGAVISTNGDRHTLERLFIHPEEQGKGYGHQAWHIIENTYPCKEWMLRTPTCLINNVCFYVNKCGFSIIRVEDMGNDGVGMFVFTKTVE